VLRAPAFLFSPTTAYQFTQPPSGSELRSQRGWRAESAPYGADIAYRVATSSTGGARISIVNAVGDTVARLTGPSTAGINHVTWNFQLGANVVAGAGGFGGGGGRGGRGAPSGPVNDPGFPPGFNPRPAESRAAPDSSLAPTFVVRPDSGGRGGAAGGGRGGGGGGGGRGRGAASSNAPTGDYAVVLQVNGVTMKRSLRVVDMTGAASGTVVF
jgi:hypothetical protein